MDNKDVKKHFIASYFTQANPIFAKSLDDDSSLENNMKESLNRIGDSEDETTKPETPDNEDVGD